MEWFEGEVGVAVAKAKENDACLVVFIEGTDESSKRLALMFTNENIYKMLNGKQFVAIRFTKDSESYMHFSRIYFLVPVPSIFFIGKNGTPIEIATSQLQTHAELQVKIENVIKVVSGNIAPLAPRSSVIPITNTTTTDTPACSGGVCTLPQVSPSPSQMSQAQAQPMHSRSLEEKLKSVHKENDTDDTRQQREQYFKDMQEQIRRKKLVEQEARDRVRAQIAADRLEQAHSSGQITKPPEPVKLDNQVNVNANQTQNVRLQFRLPNGETSMRNFESHDEFTRVRAYVREQVLGGNQQQFSLAISYPKRDLGTEYDETTLQELGLYPSAVILVIFQATNLQNTAVRVRFDNFFAIISNIFVSIFVTPVMSVANYLRNAIYRTSPRETASGQSKKDDDFQASNLDAATRRRGNRDSRETPNDDTARRWAGGSNVHRLRDQNQNDDEDNATWNGNSTQQQ